MNAARIRRRSQSGVRVARVTRVVVFTALIASALACGGAGKPPVQDALSARFATSAAKQGAPDLYARAVRALEAAAAAPTAEQTVSGRVLAEVWLDAAEAEAARIETQREAAVLFAQLDAAQRARIDDEQARRDAAAELLRRDAARIARAQAAQAFEQAKLDEQGRRTGAEVDALRRAAATALLARARLVLAAAAALGAPPPAIENASKVVDAAGARTRDATAALTAANSALDTGLSVLGAARALRPGPSAEERASLLAAAADRGLTVQLAPRGLLIDLGAAFTGRSARLGKSAKAALSQVRSLLAAHPHGPVMVEAYAPPGGGAKLAAKRAQATLKALALPERAKIAPGASALASDGHLVVVLTAYSR